MVLDLVEQTVAGLLSQIEAVPADQLLSVTVALPACAEQWALPGGGDSYWHGRDGSVTLVGRGVAAEYSAAQTTEFALACANWRRLGMTAVAPVAWFSAATATSVPGLSVRVPQVLWRREGHHATLCLTARKGGASAAEIATSWRDALAALWQTPAQDGQSMRINTQQALPNAEDWQSRVRKVTEAIAAGELDKVVLARRLDLALSATVCLPSAIATLAREYPDCFVLAFPHGPGAVLAASPELLASKRDQRLQSYALAGTARRHPSPSAASAAAAALLDSAKERHEHQLVVDAIAKGMDRLCVSRRVPAQPTVQQLRFVQHLWTPLSGVLRHGVGLLDAVQALHPTPAVLGFPAQAARDWLSRHEESRQGHYTGVFGWIDAAGDGDGVVVLRSAYVEGRSATIWAGAGIVAGSDPASEWAETEMKMATMLEALQRT